MKKSIIKRRVWKENGIITEEILGYKHNYNDIDYGIYNCKDYNCQYHNGYIPVLICENEKCNGLALTSETSQYKTIKECIKETMKIIDKNKEYILKRIKEEL